MAINFYNYILTLLNVPHTNKNVSNYANTQPYGNSYQALKIFLSKYNIASSGIKIVDKEAIDCSICPFITTFQGEWCLVNNISENFVKIACTSSPNKDIEIPKNTFCHLWDGTGLLIDNTTAASEPHFYEHQKQEIWGRLKNIALILAGIILVALCLSIVPHKNNVFYYSILTINLFGTYIGFLLLQKQLHIPSSVSDKLCGFIKESHCESVTDSAGASILGLVKLSEIGFGFFITNLLVLLFVPQAITELAIVAIIVLPFSFWSIWYQKFKARSWCVLCLITLFLMWSQAILYFAMGRYQYFHLNIYNTIIVISSYVLIVLTVNKVMSLLENYQLSKHWEKDFRYLKAQEKVVSAIFDLDKRYDISADSCSTLTFGNKDAKRVITIFSNPYCGPCAKMHERIKNLPGECVKVQYIMTAFSEDRTIINKYIIAAYQKFGAEKTWEILSEWYAGGKWQEEDFFTKYELDIDNQTIEQEFVKQREWPKDKPFTGTPTVLVNGYELVWPYEIEDYMEIPL